MSYMRTDALILVPMNCVKNMELVFGSILTNIGFNGIIKGGEAVGENKIWTKDCSPKEK